MLDDTIEQLRGMVGFVEMSKNTAYTPVERHGYLMFAVMHACQAAIYGNANPLRWGFTIHDYKHELIKAAESVMNSKPIDEAMSSVQECPIVSSIDWNYFQQAQR